MPGSIQLPYKGTNVYGEHDDYVDVNIYETFQNGDIISSCFNEPYLKSLMSQKVKADRFPCSLTAPKSYHEVYDFGPEMISHSIFTWESEFPDSNLVLELDLRPIYTVRKAIFVMSKWTEILSFHKLDLLCEPL